MSLYIGGNTSAVWTTYNTTPLYQFKFALAMSGNAAYTIRLSGWNDGTAYVRAQASHWSNTYMLFKHVTLAMDAYSGMTEFVHESQTSSPQGAWSFSRPSSGQTGYQSHLIITKSAGSYGGGMRALIEITTQRLMSVVSIS